MEAYSVDLRSRVVQACEEGGRSHQEIAEDFRVSRSFLQKLLRRFRETGSVAAKPHSGGSMVKVTEEHRQQLLGLVDRHPDDTLKELRGKLVAHGGPSVSIKTVWLILRDAKVTLKKRACTPANATRRV